MGTKLLVGKESIELQRGAVIPREGDTLVVTLKGQKKEKLYIVHLIEHVFNFNMAVSFGNTNIHLKELKDIESDD